MLARISDPGHKQDRHGAMYEGRELFIANVPWDANWKDLKERFKLYGSVESARVPKKLNGGSKGIGYVVFRRKEDAEKAMALIMTDWNGRTLNVSVSTNDPSKRHATVVQSRSQRTTASPSPQSPTTNVDTGGRSSKASLPNKAVEIQSRTIALLNIPDTVNDAKIRALAEPYGELVKVVLRLDHQGVVLEYKNQASAGKASLGLDGHEITPGRNVKVGSVQEMKQLKEEKRFDKIGAGPKKSGAALPAPSQVRRPGVGAGRRGGKGGLGVKRGVGLNGDRATSDGKGKDGDADADHVAYGGEVKAKSNADFKAMLLQN